MKIARVTFLFVAIGMIGGLAACAAPAPATPGPEAQISTMVAATLTAERMLQEKVAEALTAMPRPTVTPEPTAGVTPEGPSDVSVACANGGPGRVPYVDDLNGFCFLYPEDFKMEQPAVEITLFYGPAVDKNLMEPLRAAVTIQKVNLDVPKDLEKAAAMLWKESRREFVLTQMKLGSEPALSGENLVLGEMDMATRQVLVFHNGSLYSLSFSPFDGSDPWVKALPDSQRAWDLITSTFNFIR